MLSVTAPSRATRLSSERMRPRLECRVRCIENLHFAILSNCTCVSCPCRAEQSVEQECSRCNKRQQAPQRYCGRVGSQCQGQAGGDRVEDGLRFELAGTGFFIPRCAARMDTQEPSTSMRCEKEQRALRSCLRAANRF